MATGPCGTVHVYLISQAWHSRVYLLVYKSCDYRIIMNKYEVWLLNQAKYASDTEINECVNSSIRIFHFKTLHVHL